MENPETTCNDASENWRNLLNALTGGKNLIDISQQGIDFNLLGFSAGIGVLAERNTDSTNAGLKARVSTPWGSTASAGFQGNLGSTGLGGGVWARGALTPDIAAKAGVGGNIGPERVNGEIMAAAKTPLTGEHVADLKGDCSLKMNG